MLGPSAVGKTSLVRQYVDGIFSDKYLTTLGVKIDKKELSVSNNNFLLMLWDIEGTDKYSGFQPRYMRGASAIILVTDSTRVQTFIDAVDILKQARLVTNIPAILVINKSDLKQEWSIQDQQLLNVDKEFISTVYTSAKTGDSVEQVFEIIGNHFVKEQ
jgi:small GTP-binding protein